MMVINMNEERLDTILKIKQFLDASAPIEFSARGDDRERYGHIRRVLKRFDYPRRGKRERGCCSSTWNAPAATAGPR